jgi:hypothetical protein
LITLLAVIAGGALVLAVSLVHRHSAHATAAAPAPIFDTLPPTTASWIPPSGFSVLPDDPDFAYKALPLSETHCTGFNPCLNVTVISHQECYGGVAVTVSIERRDGTVVDSATDRSYEGVAPGQATLLMPENATGQSDVVGHVTDIRCY